MRDIKRQLVALSLSAQISERGHLDLNYLWQHSSQLANTDFKVPTDATAQETFYQPYPERDPAFDSRFQLASAAYRYDLSAHWSLNLNAGHIRENRQGVRPSSDTLTNTDVLLKQAVGEDRLIIPLGGRVAVPLSLSNTGADWNFQVGDIRSLMGESDRETNQQAALLLNGSTATGPWQHKLTLGLDWRQQNLAKSLIAEVNDFYPDRVWRLSSYNAVLNDIAKRLFSPNRELGRLEPQATQLINSDTSLLATDSITLTDNWIVSLGSRYSHMQGDLRYSETEAAPKPRSNTRCPALTIRPLRWAWCTNPLRHALGTQTTARPCANYRIDAPQATNAQPETSNQYELGLKSLAFDGRLLTSLGIYRIHKDGISEIIPKRGTLNTLNYYAQSARGLDLDLSWQISPQWDLMASTGWVDGLIESGSYRAKGPLILPKTPPVYLPIIESTASGRRIWV